MLVRTPHGLGRVVERDAKTSVVEFFDHAGPDGTVRLPILTSSALPAVVSPETRVHLPGDDGWRHGRVMDHMREDRVLYVKLEGGSGEQRVAEDDARVRWYRPLSDPSIQLSAFSVGSRRFHNTRSRFVAEYRRRRLRFSGLTAIASASIEIHSHQVEAARKVLNDPIQRYLLADEVGLGKTIEAGTIIRQHLLDGEHPDVVVVAPTHLLEQWEAELDDKLRLREQFPYRIRLLDVAGVTNLPADEVDEIGMLVIDEAHEVVASSNASEAVFRLARQVPKLLLLTATPVMSNVEGYYRILNLLSPSAHPLDAFDRFERILESREDVGEALAGLAEEDGDVPPAFLVRDSVEQLREAIPDDEVLHDHLDRVLAAIDDEAMLSLALAATRAHVSETHRIHSRMVRSRRGAGLAKGYPVLGRSRPVIVEGAARRPDELIQAWRTELAVRLSDTAPDGNETSRWLHGLEAACASLPTLRAWCRSALEAGTIAPPEHDRLSDLAAAVEAATDCRRLDVAATTATEAAEDGDAVAVACLSDAAATQVAELIRKRAPRLQVGLIITDGVSDAMRFEQGEIDVVVFGPAGEQGHNLQRAQTVVHAETPWNANRLEQRIGRFDRFGVGSTSAMHMVITDGAGSLDEGWLTCLQDGLEIFDTSAASIQDVVDEMTPRLLAVAIRTGADGLVEEIPHLRETVAAARRRLANEEALDGVNLDPMSRRCLAAIDDADANEAVDPWRAAVIDWATTGGTAGAGLRFTCRGVAGLGRRVTFGLSRQALPLIPIDHLRSRFSGLFDRDRPWFEAAFNRGTARNRGVRLLEPGDPFIEALWEFTQSDDRGRSFSSWRTIPTLDASARGIWWMFDIVFRPDVRPATRVASEQSTAAARSIVRRAEASLEPMISRVWISAAGEVETDPATLLMLEPGDAGTICVGGRDETIRPSHRRLVDELVPRDEWADIVQKAREHALEHARGQLNVLELGERAAHEVTTAAHEAAARARARADADADAVAAHELAVGMAMAAGMRDVAVEIDACGFVILSGSSLDGATRSDD